MTAAASSFERLLRLSPSAVRRAVVLAEVGKMPAAVAGGCGEDGDANVDVAVVAVPPSHPFGDDNTHTRAREREQYINSFRSRRSHQSVLRRSRAERKRRALSTRKQTHAHRDIAGEEGEERDKRQERPHVETLSPSLWHSESSSSGAIRPSTTASSLSPLPPHLSHVSFVIASCVRAATQTTHKRGKTANTDH